MKLSLRWFGFGVALAAILLAVVIAQAQITYGTLLGTVTDPSDAVIPGATVTVLAVGTGQTFTATTSEQGTFTIPNLPQGFYRVTIEREGFSKYVNESVQVYVGQPTRITAKLELGQVRAEIVVAAEQAGVDTETVEIKASVDSRQLRNLPLITRNPLDLVRTMAGVVTPTSSGIADSFVHGLRGNSTNLTQDGINIADNFVKTSAFFSIASNTAEETGEFSVSIGGIGVDSGFGAAQVSLRTQRGSNDFHGSLFWYQRTSAFNAINWFANAAGRRADGSRIVAKPFQLQNRVGFTAGGPLRIPGVYNGRDKTWLFGFYELLREPSQRTRVRSVMTPAARTGQFTFRVTCLGTAASPCPAGVTPGQTQTANLLSLGTIGTTGLPVIVNTAVMNYYNSIVPSPNSSLG